VAEQPIRAGGRVRPQPVADIDRQHDPPVAIAWQRHPGQRPPHPGRVDPTGGQRVIQRPMPPPMLRHQRQPHQRGDRPVGAQHRITQLKQRVRPRHQAVIQLLPKHHKIVQTRPTGRHGTRARIRHTVHHGHRHPRVHWTEPEDDQAVVASRHADTPNKINDHHEAKRRRLNDKLRTCRRP